ncbi:Hypothetical protein A7982_02607 [Minicystis rosea]|nr:Hypothetical protein A7982_02607 [Minicystis rosea]
MVQTRPSPSPWGGDAGRGAHRSSARSEARWMTGMLVTTVDRSDARWPRGAGYPPAMSARAMR